ncbi:MAG: serine hydrolase, partial [Stenotrophomonas sp.]
MTQTTWTAVLVGLAMATGTAAASPAAFDPMFDQARQQYALPGLAMAVVEDGQVIYQRTAGERRSGSGE